MSVTMSINDIDEMIKGAESLNIEYLNERFKHLSFIASQYANNDLLSLKSTIEIFFLFNQNIRNDPNASVRKINDKKYEILIGRKLLLLLDRYSHKIFEDDLIFSNLKRNEDNKEKIRQISLLIFYFWMEFVCLHELMHVVRSHMNFKNGSYTEFNINKNESVEDSVYFEADADRYAIEFLATKLVKEIENIKVISNEYDDEIIIKNFIFLMLYLFDLFFVLNGSQKKSNHPTSLERINIIFTSLVVAGNLKGKMTMILLMRKAIHEFMAINGSKYRIDRIKFFIYTSTLMYRYLKFTKKKDLDNVQILHNNIWT